MPNTLIQKIQLKHAQIGVIGLGYVGLPLIIAFHKAGFRVTGFDLDQRKVDLLAAGVSYIKHIELPDFSNCSTASFNPTTDFLNLKQMDCIQDHLRFSANSGLNRKRLIKTTIDRYRRRYAV